MFLFNINYYRIIFYPIASVSIGIFDSEFMRTGISNVCVGGVYKLPLAVLVLGKLYTAESITVGCGDRLKLRYFNVFVFRMYLNAFRKILG